MLIIIIISFDLYMLDFGETVYISESRLKHEIEITECLALIYYIIIVSFINVIFFQMHAQYDCFYFSLFL